MANDPNFHRAQSAWNNWLNFGSDSPSIQIRERKDLSHDSALYLWSDLTGVGFQDPGNVEVHLNFSGQLPLHTFNTNPVINDDLSQVTEQHLNFWPHPELIDIAGASANPYNMDISSTNIEHIVNPTDPASTGASSVLLSPSWKPEYEASSSTTHSTHREKQHEFPYVCKIPNCKHPNFKDKSGLARHEREVHSSQTFRCPIPSCKRHIKGFNRAYNLEDHTKRCHSQTQAGRMSRSPRPSRSRQSKSIGAMDESDDPMSPKSIADEEMAGEKSPRLKLHERLEVLRALRANIDADIQAVERTMEIL